MPNHFVTQAQQAWKAADTLNRRSEGAERADAHQFWLEQAQKKQSQAQALALLAIAADLNQRIITWQTYEDVCQAFANGSDKPMDTNYSLVPLSNDPAT